MAECRSLPQMCLLGPVPPRTPGRSDAQVPSDASRGDSKYGRIAFVYFYQDGVKADPLFGLLDIEIAIQRRGPGAFQFEIYCIGDGYQSGHGSSQPQPLAIEFRNGAAPGFARSSSQPSPSMSRRQTRAAGSTASGFAEPATPRALRSEGTSSPSDRVP